MEEFAATAAPAKKNAGPPVTETGEVIRRVFIPETVDFIEQTEAPLAVELVQDP